MTVSLSPGRKLGHYEVAELIGKGGMGEVYRAKDTKLGRDVAIKVLPDAFAEDTERVARFSREARVLASLNHPNIAAIHGLEDIEGLHFLVLELVEGETLADRIARGPIPLDDALEIALEIAAALEAAHDQGVVHRDLKPANIKLTPDDRVKVLDYGLAKALHGDAEDGARDSSMSMSPTMTRNATVAGVILGTAAYMSPEQAKGTAVDKSADLWAFGVVSYEMLTGKRPFVGDDVSETLAAVLRDEPDWGALPESTPEPVLWLVRRCLDKKRRERVADASNIRFAVEQVRHAKSGPEATAPSDEGVAHPRGRSVLVAASALAGAAAAFFVALALGGLREVEAPAMTVQPLYLPPNLAVRSVAISPDGRSTAFIATRDDVRQLYLRELDALEPRALPGTEGARVVTFSPDGERVAYGLNDAYRAQRLDGGAPETLVETRSSLSRPAWGPTNQVVFGSFLSGLRISRLAGEPGVPSVLTTPDQAKGERAHSAPSFLPGTGWLLFGVLHDSGMDRVAIADTSASTTAESDGAMSYQLLFEGTEPRFVPKSGHLVFQRDTTLWAAAFDAERHEVVSEPTPVLDNVASYDVSADGTLLYVPSHGSAERTLVWVDRGGVETPLEAPARAYYDPVVSPDGARVAATIDGDIWTWDAERAVLIRLTSHPSDDFGMAWSPDGARIAFQAVRDGRPAVFTVPTDAAEEPVRVWQGDVQTFPADWVDEPNRLITSTLRDGAMQPMQLDLELGPEAELEPVLGPQSYANRARVSPDRRWIAYQSLESGPFNVFVRPYQESARGRGRWQVSTNGGQEPMWSADGRTLYYRTATHVMAVEVSAEESQGDEDTTFSPSAPHPLFEITDYDISRFPQTYGLAPDGRFLFLKPVVASDMDAPPPMVLIQNWATELERRAPAER